MLGINRYGDIALSRGDAMTLQVTFEPADDETELPEDGTACVLTVKASAEDQEALLEKRAVIEAGSCCFRIDSADTAGMDFGQYAYDVRVLYETGDVYTPIYRHLFKILEVIGNGA